MSADELLRIHFPKFEMYEMYETHETPNIKRMTVVNRSIQKAIYEIMADEDEEIFAALCKRMYNICG